LNRHRSRLVVTTLLLVSAILASIGSLGYLQPVAAAPSISLNPTFARIGAIVKISGSGFANPGDNGPCTLSLTDRTAATVAIATSSCTISGGGVSGSFVVPNVLSILNPYTLEVTGTTSDSAIAAFTIVSITITPSSGPRGATIMVNGTVGSGDTTCSISGSVRGQSSCVISSFVGGNFTGTFVVANVNPGPYTLRVSGSPSGVFVEATFTVTGPSITLTPNAGRIGIRVAVNGTGFSFADTSCTLSSPTSGSATLNPACSINAGTGIVKGNFTVGNVAPGSYVIQIRGSTGDFAQAVFVVLSGPAITLTPLQGPQGSFVNMNGTGFQTTDSSCSISGTVVSTPACSIVVGTGAVKGNFTVASVITGTYLVTVTGSSGDFAQASFIVTLPTGNLTLYPTQGIVGTTVTFRATGFLPTDRGCIVQSAGNVTDAGNSVTPNNALIGSQTCSLSAQVATGNFVVGNLATANIRWNVTVKGTAGNDVPIGEWAAFTVVPRVTVRPTTGTNGTVVSMSGNGFSSTTTSCTLVLVPSTGSQFINTNCGLSGSTGQVSGSFIVNQAPPGIYIVNVTDAVGEFGGTLFQVGLPSANITLNPNTASIGNIISITGTGFNPSDTSCDLAPLSIMTGQVCSISAGVVAASFIIAPSTTSGYYVVSVTGNHGDFASNILVVAILTGTTTSTTSTSIITSSTSFTTTTTSVNTYSTLTTTTFTWTGVYTYTSWTFTTTTVTGQSTYATTQTSVETSTNYAVTSVFTTTTSSTQTKTYGMVVQPSYYSQLGSYDAGSALGALAMTLLMIGLVIRRFFV
jgi:hypothetical protein